MRQTNEKENIAQRGGSVALPTAHDRNASNQAGHHCPTPAAQKITEVPVKRLLQEQADNSHYFSDEFQPLLNTQGAVKYVREDVSHFELKKLRRGIIRRSCFSICTG
jgi:DNA-nicking Smr family endonuclease